MTRQTKNKQPAIKALHKHGDNESCDRPKTPRINRAILQQCASAPRPLDRATLTLNERQVYTEAARHRTLAMPNYTGLPADDALFYTTTLAFCIILRNRRNEYRATENKQDTQRVYDQDARAATGYSTGLSFTCRQLARLVFASSYPNNQQTCALLDCLFRYSGKHFTLGYTGSDGQLRTFITTMWTISTAGELSDEERTAEQIRNDIDRRQHPDLAPIDDPEKGCDINPSICLSLAPIFAAGIMQTNQRSDLSYTNFALENLAYLQDLHTAFSMRLFFWILNNSEECARRHCYTHTVGRDELLKLNYQVAVKAEEGAPTPARYTPEPKAAAIKAHLAGTEPEPGIDPDQFTIIDGDTANPSHTARLTKQIERTFDAAARAGIIDHYTTRDTRPKTYTIYYKQPTPPTK